MSEQRVTEWTLLESQSPLEGGDKRTQLANRAFGEDNRRRLLSEYFETNHITPENAWRHAYRLLLWIDRTIGLAHCYESDKCQPGRPWYARSLAFHDWVSTELDVAPSALGHHIDWLFKRASADLAELAVATGRSSKIRQQRAPYEPRGFPEPGEDPELVGIILDELRPWLQNDPPSRAQLRLTERILTYLNQENKRKNLIGEGFEDTLSAILTRIPGVTRKYDIHTRIMLHELPGFHRGPINDKPRQVDLTLVERSSGHRILITAKWSVRADREEQFTSDFWDYTRDNYAGNFDYVLVTNEFDAARLVRACERSAEGTPLFTDVVHVNPAGPTITYSDTPKDAKVKATDMLRHIRTGRLVSLHSWLAKLTNVA